MSAQESKPSSFSLKWAFWFSHAPTLLNPVVAFLGPRCWVQWLGCPETVCMFRNSLRQGFQKSTFTHCSPASRSQRLLVFPFFVLLSYLVSGFYSHLLEPVLQEHLSMPFKSKPLFTFARSFPFLLCYYTSDHSILPTHFPCLLLQLPTSSLPLLTTWPGLCEMLPQDIASLGAREMTTMATSRLTETG